MSEQLSPEHPYAMENVIGFALEKGILSKTKYEGRYQPEFAFPLGKFGVEAKVSPGFWLRYSLSSDSMPLEWRGKLFAFASSYDEDVTREFYYNAEEDEEVSEEEFYDNCDTNDNYYEDSEVLGTKTDYHFAFAPMIFGENSQAVFNVLRDDAANMQTLFVPQAPFPFELLRGADMLRALKKSVMNNDPENDLSLLQGWVRLSKDIAVPSQTRITINLALEEFKSRYPQVKEMLK